MTTPIANAASIDSKVAELQQSLPLRLSQVEYVLPVLPEIVDKWVLSSALQKLIRRGQPDWAIAVATRLHQLDPGYLPRRLPIIAVEDIGVGDLGICHDVLNVCGSLRWWRVEPVRAIAFVVGGMARAVKSRAACDAICLAETHHDGAAAQLATSSASVSQLIDLAADPRRRRLERLHALRLLGGVTERQGARYVQISRCNLPALDQVAIELKLAPLMRWLIGQNRRTGNLACMLPIVAEAVWGMRVRSGGEFPRSLEDERGVPLCSVDMFSEVGRGTLREFFLTSSSFKAFAAEHVQASSALRLFHMALFHAESSKLDRYLSSDGLDGLTFEVEREEMRHLGMREPERRRDLRALIVADADRLAQIRRYRLGRVAAGQGSHHAADEGVDHG